MNPSLWISKISHFPLERAEIHSLQSGDKRVHFTDQTSFHGSVEVSLIPLTGTLLSIYLGFGCS